MNRVFRIIWSRELGTWVVTSELVSRRGKGRGRSASAGVDERQSSSGARGQAHLLSAAVLAGLMALHAPSALSAERYWDVNTGAANNGGTGTWNTSSALWNSASDGVAGPFVAWNNNALDDAVFAGVAGTVTLGTPIVAHNLTFSVEGYTLTGGNLTLAGVAPVITTGPGVTTIASALAGSAGLTKAGGGQLLLSGNNTFQGDIAVQAGTLIAASNAALGDAANRVTLGVGTIFEATGALGADRVVEMLAGGANDRVTLRGAGVGSARLTGAGTVAVRSGVTLSNAASDYTGNTVFLGGGTYSFSSVGMLGEASALGAPTDAAKGRIRVEAGGGLGGNVYYTGTGNTSDRDWEFANTSSGGNLLGNTGTGTLTLTGDIAGVSTSASRLMFQATNADIALLGSLSTLSDREIQFSGGTGRKVTLGGGNTYAGGTTINSITVEASVLANFGNNSSFGTGAAAGGPSTIGLTNGTLAYTGLGDVSNRTFTFDGNTRLANNGAGSLILEGASNFFASGQSVDTLTLGGTYTGSNSFSGPLSGIGNVVMDGAGSWMLGGANTYTGTTTVNNGTLVAGGTQAFGASTGVIVNGGVLDLNDLQFIAPSLAGTGGSVDLGSGTLTLRSPSGSTAYAGSIVGTGGLTKLGASTQTLSGANTYTGTTTVGGGTLALDFAAAGAPASQIINAASTLAMSGGTLSVNGASGARTQNFAGLDVTAGNNRISATAGSGGSLTVGLGNINRSGGLVDFTYNTGATITTTRADGALGGWATVNGTDYAQVSAGVITAFTDYQNKDDAGQWLDGDIVSDSGGNANTAYFGNVAGTIMLGGLKYAAAATSTVNVGTGNLLGVDGTIIVASSAGTSAQTIQGGSLSGGTGGGALGVQQNSAGTFNIGSTITDNGVPTAFTVGGSGTGSVVVTGNNDYTGATTVSGSTLRVNSIGNGGQASAIGASSADSSNLVIENGTLFYDGTTTTTDRGFTLVNGGPSRSIQVSGSANLTFSGQVTSPDDAGFSKTGAGTLTLANAGNDFVGPVTVSEGTLSVGTLADGGQASGIGAGSSASASLVLQSGGGLQYTGGSDQVDRGFTLATGNGRIDVSQAATTLTLDGVAVGTGRLFKEGAGTLVLGGTNTHTGGNTVTAGILRAGSDQAFGGTANGTGAGSLTVDAGATADLDGHDVWVSGLNGAGDVTLGSGMLQLRGVGTFTGAISGTGSVAANAFSQQVLNGCGNSYTGATFITSGRLSTDCLADGGQNSGIGASSSDAANLTLNSGTFTYTGGTVETDRGMFLAGNGTVSVDNAATVLTMGGTVASASTSGNLTKQGAGTLLFSGNNTYAGNTTVAAGVLRAGSTQAFGTGNMHIGNAATATLDLAGFDNSLRSLAGGGAAGGTVLLGSATMTLSSANSGLSEFAGVISGSGSVVKAGSYRQQLSGCSSDYTGSTTVQAGTLLVNCLDDGGETSSIGAATADAANLVLDGGTLQYVGTGGTTDRLFTLGPSLTSALDASGVGSVQFTNTGAIAFTTSGTAQRVTLTGTHQGDNSLAAQITDNGGGLTSVSKTGAGTWILENANSTYTGVTTISGGVLGVEYLTDGLQASSIGASSSAAANLVIGNGATLRYTGAGDTTDRLFTLSLGTSVIESSGTGAIEFTNTGSAAYAGNGNRTLGLGGTNTDDNTMGGTIIDGPGGVTTLAKNGSGTWLLTGTNTYTGRTTVNEGILQLGNGGTTGSIAGGEVEVDADGTLAFNRSDVLLLGNTIAGAGDVRQSGSGTTVLTAANTYTGGTSITAGTLQLGDGGTGGSILGDVANDGILAFNRTNGYIFDGLVYGAGGVTQDGPGVTTLTASNSYAGVTSVQAGTLLINGDQQAATGLTQVQNGAILGGRGTIGGDVVLTGGTLNPGDATGAPGTLTINGSLSLDAASRLDFRLGQPDVVGGTLNDLVVVHGDLDLDGTLNVTATPGGSFGPGLYRIISYDGALTDRGLDIGAMPAGAFQVQTSMANQVNLLNSGGLTLNFWDGPSGAENNVIDGGDGIWQNSVGNGNWTDQTGRYNAPYTNGEFAIFSGTGGTVTVDTGLGAVDTAGMQFAVDGYIIDGDALTLTGAPSIFRVGDGTAAGAGMTATIDASLEGSGGLVKDDLGTLVLNGSNTYTGGTAVNAGTLQVSADDNLGDASGGLSSDGGTLHNTGAFASARAVTINQGGLTLRTSADLDLSGTIDGSGALVKSGAGELTLGGSNTYSGGTSIVGGTVVVSSNANLGVAGGALSLDGGTLRNTAAFSSNRGVTLGANGGTFDTVAELTLGGAMGGAGGLVKSGGGTLLLTGDATHAGGTTIQDGTLQLGNGGTSGSLLGDVVNNGALVFNRSDRMDVSGLVSGNGAVEQSGAGTTVLSADNLYTGPTSVRAGTLVINGDQSGATGTTTVDAAATLGGRGVIGGDLTIADGGVLAPGDVGSAPGTLTVAGNLVLGSTSTLEVDLGQANVVGGPLNDLVQVAGDLTLGGTLNVSVASGGTFDPGIYRVIGYDGSLTDNGLAIGTVPSSDYFLQTAIAQQVNLVNTAGLDVNFWDGTGPRDDGQVQGGDGVWQNNSGNDYWTVIDGALNAPYQDNGFAIFGATAGTVSVDADLGAINSAGMQFATDGYRIEGDGITLTGTPIIRVGDGTTASSDMTATIASVLSGSDGLGKNDLGTLVLAGDNLYTGGTTINDGTLQLGEGGTSGSILGDVTNNGTLAFQRSDVHAFDGTISGDGNLDQRGTGTTVLGGTNTYAGTTTVSAGSLLVNGDQSGATGATSVLDGATLGGVGTLGGDLVIADGGTLSPGAAAGVAGTLTVNGNLTLDAGARLDYQFGQSGTPGGALNDLTVVRGDLVLDGTLNVTTTPGGSFGPGVYRLFSYDGALTNGGLIVGTPSTDAFVQTSIAQQVNLVNTSGLTLDFWDGPGHANDGAITGGDGVWRLADNDNWTEASGAINAPFSDAAFAVFSATAGTVTVDNSNGTVSASGMQFQSDGYRIVGDDLLLSGGVATVRVGDGTSAGADVTATIDSALLGPSMLVKDDLGTLVLTGENRYAGGTNIHAGTLQIANDGNLGAAAGNLLLDDGTLHTTASFESARTVGLGGEATFDADADTTLTLNGNVGGSGSLTKAGLGTLVLGGSATYDGPTTVAAGTLAASGENLFNAASAFSVGKEATLDLGGFSQALSTLSNAGTVHFGGAPGATLTVSGNYTGQGGMLSFNTALGGDDSATDRLVVAGDTSGDTVVRVTNVGGTGAQTTQGIKLIDVQGLSEGTFTLSGDYVFQGEQAVVAGAYAYRLYQDGADAPDGDWYLRSALLDATGPDDTGGTDPSPLYQPGVPLYEAYAGMLQQLNTLDTLAQRVGGREWQSGRDAGNMQPGEGVWMRASGSDRTLRPETSTSGTHYDISTWKAEAGVDATLSESGTGVLVGGATLQYGRNHADVRSVYGQGRIATDNYGVGASLTWYDHGGAYVDGQARWMRFDSDLRSTTLARMLKDSSKAYGHAVSVEAGRRFGIDDHWSVVPQVQVSYGSARFDGFNDAFGTRVSQDDGKATTARGGVAIDYKRSRAGVDGPVATHVYALANLYRNIGDTSRADVAGTRFVTRNERTWGGVGLGGSLDWGGGRYSVYGEVQANAGLSGDGDSHALNGTAGFRVRW